MIRLSDAEIMDRWEVAIDKAKALDQLAVACRTDRARMRQKLRELGLLEELPQSAAPTAPSEREPSQALRASSHRGGAKTLSGAARQLPQGGSQEQRGGKGHKIIDDEKAKALYDLGRNDKEIAEAFGITAAPVCAWRKKNGLPSNYKPGGGTTGEAPSAAAAAAPSEREPEGERGRETGGRFRLETPVRVARPMTVGDFLSTLSRLLPKEAETAELYIDGIAVGMLYGYSLTMPDGVPKLDVLTDSYKHA